MAEFQDEVVKFLQNPQEWHQVSDLFARRWNFQHTLGAIDGKHIAIKRPAHSGSTFHNYKGFFSVILFALVDSDYKFIWADVSANGVASDAQIWNASELKAGLVQGTIMGWPRPDPLPHDTQDVPYFLLGDDAFSLRTYLMKPYGLSLIHI